MTLTPGGGALRLRTDSSALPTIQNILVAEESLRMSVSSPVAPGPYIMYAKRSEAFGARLTLNLPHVKRKTEVDQGTLILPYRPFKHWDGNNWIEIVSNRFDEGRWIGLPWRVYHGGTWRM